MSWEYYPPYVSVAERRAKAAKEIAKLAKRGVKMSPVEISGRNIANTFWGKAWCQHLESFRDYETRLQRGRTYARNGSIIDLKIEPLKISAQVMGSSLYKQTITIEPLAESHWKAIKTACSGRIDSLIELLQGHLSDSVMAVLTDKDQGMFPKPEEISMRCSCPDYALLCKHLAAVLYGIGARLDTQPEILFTLRNVDSSELLSEATSAHAVSSASDFDSDSLADVFGIDIAPAAAAAAAPKTKAPAKKAKAPAKPVKKSAAPSARKKKAPKSP
jgi:uncharacterized Zn finger protein